jgi:hypothetical protein
MTLDSVMLRVLNASLQVREGACDDAGRTVPLRGVSDFVRRSEDALRGDERRRCDSEPKSQHISAKRAVNPLGKYRVRHHPIQCVATLSFCGQATLRLPDLAAKHAAPA